ncbi:polysaccharide biosynthesis C-terminal domain-containing protein, partial [Candidatus Woesearchaeota archaeon]|nr:polysaccharide biosynthesis C-terminal domain-containing protein [Candidatus Woesearchaeota archaeon]
TLFGIHYVNSAVPLLILSIGYFMNYLVMNATNTLIIFKKTKLIFIDLLIATFLNIILNYLLIPHYGGRGAAIATSISFTLAGILYFLQAKKLTKAKLIDFSYGKTILAAGVAMLVVLSIQKWIIFEKIIFSLAVNIIIFLVLYGFLLVLLKVFSKEDKELFTLVKKRLQEIKNGQK